MNKTRKEAIQIFKKNCEGQGWLESIVDSLHELGVLRLDPPLDPFDKLEKELRLRYFNNAHVTDLREALKSAKLKLMEE